MAWADRLSDPSVTMYYYLLVEGIPQVFTSTALPSGWFTGGRSQVQMLDVSRGINVPGQQLNRKAGAASPTSMQFTLGPDGLDGALRLLFAPAKAGRKTALLTVTFSWTEAARIYVDDNTGWVNGDYVYIGPETLQINGTGVDAGRDYLSLAGAGSRGLFLSEPYQFTVDLALHQGTREMANHPALWEGRHVRLYAGFCNAAGQPLDTALGGDDTQEIWRGVINGLVPFENYKTWQMSCQSIDSILNTEIGAYMPKGRLHEAFKTAPNEWSNKVLEFVSGALYISSGQNKVYITLSTPGPVHLKASATVSTGISYSYMSAIAAALDSALTSAGAPATFEVWPEWQGSADDPDNQQWGFKIQSDTAYEDLFLNNPPDSILRCIGFTQDVVYPTEAEFDATYFYWTFLCNMKPPACYYGITATEFYVYAENTPDRVTWPSSGFAVIEGSNGKSEVIKYTGKTTIAAEPEVIKLTGVTRGACGTTPVTIVVEMGDKEGAHHYAPLGGRAPEVRWCIGFEDETLTDILLKCAVSTGSSGLRDATFDDGAFIDYSGGAFSVDHFDTVRFAEVGNHLSNHYGLRNIIISKPMRLIDMMGKELAAMGWTLLSRQTADGYQITVDRVTDPLLLSIHTLGESDIVPETWPVIKNSLAQIVNRVEMSLLWDTAKEEFVKPEYVLNALDSQINYKVANTIKVEVKGMQESIDSSYHAAQTIGTRLLAQFARRYEIIKVGVKKSGWIYRPGQQVSVSLSYMPNSDGTVGWVDVPMIILGVDQTYVGTGTLAACMLTLLRVPDQRTTYYVPCGKITNYNAGTKEITINANFFTLATQYNPLTEELCNDVDWFSASDKIYVVDPGDEALSETRTIASKVGQVLTLDAVLGGAHGINSYICYPDYDNCTATQKLYCFIADNTYLLGAANDAAMQFGA